MHTTYDAVHHAQPKQHSTMQLDHWPSVATASYKLPGASVCAPSVTIALDVPRFRACW